MSSTTAPCIGHARQVRLLRHALEHPANGFIFYGPSHIGKRLVAEWFVRSLLNISADRTLASHPDVVLIEPDEGKSTISVEAVRRARGRMSESPMSGIRMVCLVPRADRLNEEGTNALLKILEEPPSNAVFVFVTDDLSRIPMTIQSRAFPLPFEPLSSVEITAALVERGLSTTEAASRAEMCAGRIGLAIEPLVDTSIDDAQCFLNGPSLGARLAAIDRAAKQCESAEDTPGAWRGMLWAWGDQVRRAFRVDAPRAVTAAYGITTATRMIGGSLSPRLALEAAAVQLASSDPVETARRRCPTPLPKPFPSLFV